MIYTTGTIAINGNTVTGTGTDFSAPLSLIRVGCTLIAVSNPIQIFTITEIKSGTELSVTPAANPAIPAGTKFSILLSDSISVDGLAQDVAETLRYYQSKETEVAEALEWSQEHIADKIGLGAERRDWPDCNDPTGYIGFCRAEEAKARNFPSVASGELYLVGWLSRGDGSVICGCFVGAVTRSLYTYRYNASDKSVGWTRHARRDEVDRLLQNNNTVKETQLWDGEKKNYIFVNTAGWGAYSTTGAVKLGVMYGGTGAGNEAEARKNLMVMHEAKTTLSDSQNLNDLKGSAAGFYHQVLSANAKPELNYPIQIAGSLLVQKTGAGDTEGCIQTYYLFNNMAVSYRRAYGGQGWSAWTKVVSTERVSEGSETTFVYSKYATDAPRLQVSTSGLWGCHNGSRWVPLGIAQGGTGAINAEDARTQLGVGPSNSPQFLNAALKRSTDVTTGWVAGGIFHSTLAGTTGTERVYGAMYPETHLTEPDQLTFHLRTGGQSKYASLNANGEFIADTFKAKNAQQTRRNLNIPTMGGGELMTIEAPEGVEDGKYYPIVVNSSYYGAYETGYQIDIHTRSSKGEDPMNCNAFTGYVRTGGWSDRKDSGYGYYTSHSANEIALQSICASGKNQEHLLFVFVEARAFPVTMRLPVGVTATAPASQVIYNEGEASEMIVPWGVEDPLSSHKNLIVMFDFRMGRCGFYSATTEGAYYSCNGSRAILFNGINLNEEVSLTTPKLTVNGTVKSSGNYVVSETSGRFIRHVVRSSTTANAHVVTWGSSAEPLNYEVKVVGDDSLETRLKTLFTAKYLSDGSATLAVEGNITCTTVTQLSDRDLKDNIQVIGDATEAIRKMNGYTYTLKENGLPYAGVIAQEVMEALPEAVGSFTHYGEALQGPTVDGNELREETRYLNVDYAAVTGLLVQVARETDNRVTELEEENASLRANIAAMDERIAKLEALVSKLTGSEK